MQDESMAEHRKIETDGEAIHVLRFDLEHKEFELRITDRDSLELHLDGCLRKRSETEESRVLYVWTNIELDWENHRFVEARFNCDTRHLSVTVNRNEVFAGKLG